MPEISTELKRLLDAAYLQTLTRFKEEAENEQRDPAAELALYRKRRRDYASLLRMGTVPEEARTLARQLLETHQLRLDSESRHSFEDETARLLIRLYDAFIEFTDKGRQGRR